MKKIDRIEKYVNDDPKYNYRFTRPERLSSPVIRITEGEFAYPNEPSLLQNLDFAVDLNTKVALLGANGVGKSTFLKILIKQLKIQSGYCYIDPKARISMFSQHHVEKLNLALSAVEHYYELYPTVSTTLVRNHLASFGIVGSTALRPIYLLSGGEKSRVSLSLAAWENPHILILDEPTNHLDMESINALIMALNNYEGGMLIVSHDQYFVSCVCDEIWYIKSKRIRKFDGDFEDYREAVLLNLL